MMRILFLLSLITSGFSAAASNEITPFKYVDIPAPYEIPASSRFTAKRDADAPDIVYYLSKPDFQLPDCYCLYWLNIKR